jgi:hypothetical protein
MDLNRRSAGVAVVAALAGLAAVTGLPALAQGMHKESGMDQMTEEQRKELHRQLTALVAVTLAHADFPKVDQYFGKLIDANATQIGGDTKALRAHVSAFFSHLAEVGKSNPDKAAADMTQMLMQAHMNMHEG